jgi:hypothetical protein
VTSAFDDWVSTLGGSVSPEARAFLRHVFDEHGPVSSEEAGRIGHDFQLALTQEAVALVARDIAVTTAVDPPPRDCPTNGSGALSVVSREGFGVGGV